MSIIKDLLTDDRKAAIAWGKAHPKEMALKKNPYDFLDDDFFNWVIAKESDELESMSPEKQTTILKAKRNLHAKMNS